MTGGVLLPQFAKGSDIAVPACTVIKEQHGRNLRDLGLARRNSRGSQAGNRMRPRLPCTG